LINNIFKGAAGFSGSFLLPYDFLNTTDFKLAL